MFPSRPNPHFSNFSIHSQSFIQIQPQFSHYPLKKEEMQILIVGILFFSTINQYKVYLTILKTKSMNKGLLFSATLASSLYAYHQKKVQCCGIYGILSSKRDNVADPLSMGVELLKNRGYDSAGIVTFSKENGNQVTPTLLKHAEEGFSALNCIDRLVSQVTEKVKKAHIGIGHTRWATCGEKVVRNTHPHFSQDRCTYIVHNGIIGGYNQIKKDYLQGVNFTSETDSEVVAQLIEKFKKEGFSILDSIKKAGDVMKLNSVKPQWGIVIIDKENPDKMWTSTNGSPILIGFNDSEIFVASEAIAFKKDADFYFVTGDDQIFELETSKIPQLKAEIQKQGRLHYISHEDKKDVLVKQPEPYKSFYSYEIRQQGEIPFKPEFDRVKSIPFGNYLSFIACGSSYYAALASHYFFKKLKTFKKINLYDPSEMLEDDISPHETVVMISQSGQTKDLINIIADCHKIQGVKTIGIINVEGSTIARKVDFPIYIKVGREVSVAATKSMFHQMLNLIMLALQVATVKKSAPEELICEMQNQLKLVTSKIMDTIDLVQDECDYVSKLLYKKQSIYLLAMRETMAIAKEAALKIKQLNYIHAQALGACEMKHGPIALIQSDRPKETAVILFILDNDTFEVCANAFDQMRSRNALVIVVTNCKQKILTHYEIAKKKEEKEKQGSGKKKEAKQETEEGNKSFEEEETKSAVSQEKQGTEFVFIQVPKMKHFSNILSLIPMQILVEKIANLKKINPDMPRNLAKTVTV